MTNITNTYVCFWRNDLAQILHWNGLSLRHGSVLKLTGVTILESAGDLVLEFELHAASELNKAGSSNAGMLNIGVIGDNCLCSMLSFVVIDGTRSDEDIGVILCWMLCWSCTLHRLWWFGVLHIEVGWEWVEQDIGTLSEEFGTLTDWETVE